MYRSVEEFRKDYGYERGTTEKVLAALTPESLSVCKAADDPMSICDIAWHVATVAPYMFNQAGLTLDMPEKPESLTPEAILSTYKQVSDQLFEQLAAWDDAALESVDTVFGMPWPKGVTLMALVHHEIHHRGQLSVLMRQAGLTVPSIYGPNREETAAFRAQQQG